MDLVAFARNKNIGIMINTNGWFITEKIARRLKELGTHSVRVSLDGAYAETHDSFRNKRGAFSRAVTALKNLEYTGIHSVSVVSTISKHNINEVDQLIDLAASIGVREIQCVPLFQSGRGADNFDKLALSTDNYQKLRHVLERKRRQYRRKMIVYSVEGVLENNCTRCVQRGRVRPDFMGCRSGRTACNIDYNGDILPCLQVRKPVAGNIRLRSFKEIWNHSSIFKMWRRKRLEYPECLNCEWNDICIRECVASPSQQLITSEMREQRIKEIKEVLAVKKSCLTGICHMRPC